MEQKPQQGAKAPQEAPSAFGSEADVRRAYIEAIAHRIGNDKHHGWTASDSLAVIEAALAAYLPGKLTPPDFLVGAQGIIREQINSSQFMATLVKEGLLEASGKKRNAAKPQLAGLKELMGKKP